MLKLSSKLIQWLKKIFSFDEISVDTRPPNSSLHPPNSSLKVCYYCNGTGSNFHSYDIDRYSHSRYRDFESWESSRKCPICKGSGYTYQPDEDSQDK